MTAPRTLSFGCRLNTAETAAMARLAEAGGAGAEMLLVNTCAVTTEAEAQARQALRRAARADPGLRIVVTGCAATIRPEAWAGLPNVIRVVPNAEKLRPEAWGATSPPEDMAAETGSRTRALVQVQQGCDHRCTFCIIPQGRGVSRSLPAERVVARIATLAASGVAEVVLTGVDIASWTGPGEARLGDLVAAVLAGVPDLGRLRLSSLDPAAMDATLWRLLAEEPRLLPHLHLSAQHGDDLMLKRMRRRHSRADLLALARRARSLRPDVALGADLIAGFPTEDEAAFTAMLDLVAEAGLSFLHVFPYSPRPGTPAARMPQVPHALIRERAARLRAAGQQGATRFLGTRLGVQENVLLEAEDRGHSEHFAAVRLLHPVPGGRGRVVSARVTGIGPDGLLAEAA
ncbi:threonylcarbamoyladenosine tRNA methylthiotransferase MtaB [Humitalea rosea]|uniref:Threonylcarbamoyladenosine tRNA methylthiotransferase MtaB n=1 Tax=Humitalea rosea TaxID=990373 RepID=A0A2W7KDK4_9PROT|nr:MiaB/RimO family radical SAM methylthiotransferase [Humitalea rosea]PZW45702.1 threonylcarbamoyladenosine tRNA methylthiotransferase MtaB [Humitalea rosea]